MQRQLPVVTITVTSYCDRALDKNFKPVMHNYSRAITLGKPSFLFTSSYFSPAALATVFQTGHIQLITTLHKKLIGLAI